MQPIQQNAYTQKVMKHVPLFMISSVCEREGVCVCAGGGMHAHVCVSMHTCVQVHMHASYKSNSSLSALS